MAQVLSFPAAPLPLREAQIRAHLLNDDVTKAGVQNLVFSSNPMPRMHAAKVVSLRGKLFIESLKKPLPTQDFTVTSDNTGWIIRNYPTAPYPTIEIKLSHKSSEVGVMVAGAAGVDGGIWGTRLSYALRHTHLIQLQDGKGKKLVDLQLSSSISKASKELLFSAKVFRKLKYIEEKFRLKFSLPAQLSGDDLGRIGTIFRGLTEGEFSEPTGRSIGIFEHNLQANEINLPPFAGNGPFTSHAISYQEPLLGRILPLGDVTIHIERAGLANPRILRSLKNSVVISDLRLIVFDWQVRWRFNKYFARKKLLRNRQLLGQLKERLLAEEPEELVGIIDEPLTEIEAGGAASIVEGWLQFYDFPDRFAAQAPILEEERWRVPLCVTYPSGKSGLVEHAYVDLKTGRITVSLAPEELKAKGKTVAQELLCA